MNVLVWYFGFHPPHRQSWRGIFGHVSAFGYTADDTWVFIDPQSRRTFVQVTHHHDEVHAMIAAHFELCHEILRIPGNDTPVRPPLVRTCVSILAPLVGIRALSPWAFRRRLLANGAERLDGIAKGTNGKPGRQGRART